VLLEDRQVFIQPKRECKSLLHQCCTMGNTKMADFILALLRKEPNGEALAHKALDMRMPNGAKWTLLHSAAEAGSIKSLEWLLSNVPSINL